MSSQTFVGSDWIFVSLMSACLRYVRVVLGQAGLRREPGDCNGAGGAAEGGLARGAASVGSVVICLARGAGAGGGGAERLKNTNTSSLVNSPRVYNKYSQ